MGKIIAVGVGIVLVVASIIGNVVLYDFWNQEKEKTSAALMKVNGLENELKASEENKPEEMTEVAKDFTELMFGGGDTSPEKRLKSLSEVTTRELRDNLTDKDHDGHTDEVRGSENSVKILDTVYNRLDNQSAQVVVEFEHEMVVEKAKAISTINMTVKLKYIGGEWKVSDYEINSMI